MSSYLIWISQQYGLYLGNMDDLMISSRSFSMPFISVYCPPVIDFVHGAVVLEFLHTHILDMEHFGFPYTVYILVQRDLRKQDR